MPAWLKDVVLDNPCAKYGPAYVWEASSFEIQRARERESVCVRVRERTTGQSRCPRG